MTEREDAYLRHQQARWLRPDAHNWIRPDAARFFKTRTDPADVFPALAEERRRKQQAEERKIEAQIAEDRAQIETLRQELIAIKSEIARRRAARDWRTNTARASVAFPPAVPMAGNGPAAIPAADQAAAVVD